MTDVTRRVFVTALSTSLAGLAGCSGGQSGPATAEKGEGAVQLSGDSEAVAALIDALESRGVDVDSTMTVGGTVTLGYFRRPDHELQDRTRVARTYAQEEHREMSEDFLNLNVIEPDGQSRSGTYIIKQEWAAAYAAGSLSVDAYLAKINDTLQEK